MLQGRFGDTTGRPYIEGRLILTSRGLTSDVSFLVDTGADSSMLMPVDALRIGVDYGGLRRAVESVGIGGSARTFVEEATLVFSEPGRFLYVYLIELRIAPPSPDIMDLPSLLGRDVLDCWRMTYDPGKGQLAFRVRSADQSISVPGR